MALEKLYTAEEMAEYFGVTKTTILRWIKEYQDTDGKKGLRAGKINGTYRSKESWVKAYAKALYPEAAAK